MPRAAVALVACIARTPLCTATNTCIDHNKRQDVISLIPKCKQAIDRCTARVAWPATAHEPVSVLHVTSITLVRAGEGHHAALIGSQLRELPFGLDVLQGIWIRQCGRYRRAAIGVIVERISLLSGQQSITIQG